jgi:hypothetical protein
MRFDTSTAPVLAGYEGHLIHADSYGRVGGIDHGVYGISFSHLGTTTTFYLYPLHLGRIQEVAFPSC